MSGHIPALVTSLLEKVSGTHPIKGSVSSVTKLNTLVKENVCCPFRESNLNYSVAHSVAIHNTA
jgi:hypothetical protein